MEKIFTRLITALTVCILLFFSCKKDQDNKYPKTLTDIQGNVYNTVKIGKQVWMKENLKTTALNDNTQINLLYGSSDWMNTTKPAFCYVDGDSKSIDKYGLLYNSYVIQTDKICPTGWHVPTIADWGSLSAELGDDKNVGGKLKEADTLNWTYPNKDATNESGFTALPAGCRLADGVYSNIHTYAYWWEAEGNEACFVNYSDGEMDIDAASRSNFNLYRYGLSVRCVMDEIGD